MFHTCAHQWNWQIVEWISTDDDRIEWWNIFIIGVFTIQHFVINAIAYYEVKTGSNPEPSKVSYWSEMRQLFCKLISLPLYSIIINIHLFRLRIIIITSTCLIKNDQLDYNWTISKSNSANLLIYFVRLAKSKNDKRRIQYLKLPFIYEKN